MSLSRLALRLAAYEALCPFAALTSNAFPTLAGANVFDSRLTPVSESEGWEQFLLEIEGQPIVMVYTEDQKTEPVSGTSFPAQIEMVDLVVELMIAARAEVEGIAPDGTTKTYGSLSAPVSDRQTEALLDMLEAQVRYALDPAPTNQPAAPTATLYRGVALELHHVHSVPQRDGSRVSRLAARTVKFDLKVRATIWPASGSGFPSPLAAVAAGLDSSSSGGELCAALAAQIAAPATPQVLNGFALYTDINRARSPAVTPANVAGEAAPSDIKSASGTLDGTF